MQIFMVVALNISRDFYHFPYGVRLYLHSPTMISMIIGRVNLCSNKQYVNTKQLCIGYQANRSKNSNDMMNLIGLYIDRASI